MTSITAIGLVSALGTDSSTSLAAARAGLARSAAVTTVNPLLEEYLVGAPVVGYSLPAKIAEGFVGVAKATLMGRAALADLLAKCRDRSWRRTAVYVVLSNCYLLDGTSDSEEEGAEEEVTRELPSVEWRRATASFLPSLLARTPLSDSNRGHVFYGGHAAIVRALAHAKHALEANIVDDCVVGAVDSCLEPRFLRAAARAGLLKTTEVPNGLMPGEAAAFFLLQRATDVDHGLAVHLTSFGSATDARHSRMEEPPDGTGLAAAVNTCVAGLTEDQRAQLRLVISDLNGEERRALEWGYALVRLKALHPLSESRTWLPAASFGETGSATGALAICAAFRALERGYAGSTHVAIVLSSDDGEKAALCLSA